MRTHYCGQLNKSLVDQEVTLCGWVNKRRDLGGLIFLDLRDVKGLIQVDVIYRRVDDAYSDPLELKGASYLGVAGLLNVVRQQNVSILNPIGNGVLENPGLIPFMNSICKYFLKEDLILPQIASWWCGQEKERKFVSNFFLIVLTLFDHNYFLSTN